MRKIKKAEFEQYAARYFREIQATGREVVLMDRGMPVLKVVPFPAESHKTLNELDGTVVRYDDPTEPVDESSWESLG